jgi:hypothetical protein
MKVELEVLRDYERSDGLQPCWLCERRFTMDAVAAWAYSSTPLNSEGNRLDCGPMCPMCLEEGAKAMYGRLRDKLRWSVVHASDQVVEDDALLFSEGIPDIPTVEELRELERKAAFREQNRPANQRGGA